MLLNEFLKEHKEFTKSTGRLKKLVAGLAGHLAT